MGGTKSQSATASYSDACPAAAKRWGLGGPRQEGAAPQQRGVHDCVQDDEGEVRGDPSLASEAAQEGGETVLTSSGGSFKPPFVRVFFLTKMPLNF